MHRTPRSTNRLVRFSPTLGGTAVAMISVSVALMILVGGLGPSAAVAEVPRSAPWPPWFVTAHPPLELVSKLMWLLILLGMAGIVSGMLAVRRGWRPRSRYLIAGASLAVLCLTVLPAMGSADMLDYAVFGRVAALGHSPYVMTPGQLMDSGDPVGAVAVPGYRDEPARYGPVAIGTEEAASRLAGASAARTIFWLKVWNAIAYLVLVVALNRLFRTDPAGRARAHLLWSVNPLMLWAVMAGGHNDGLAVGVGAMGVFILSRVNPRRAGLAGILVGLAVGIKAPFVFFGVGLAWAARRSPRALAAVALGAAVVLAPAYLIAGRSAISATVGVATMAPVGYTPWYAVARLLYLIHVSLSINLLGLAGFVFLAPFLLWRLPQAPPEFAAVRVALAVTLAWLIAAPQQRPWYLAMIFPLLAVIQATRLDWITVFIGGVSALAAVRRPYLTADLHPHLLAAAARDLNSGIVPLALCLADVALLWLCCTADWRPALDPRNLDPGVRSPELSVPGIQS
jgi:hypothetical protein